MAMTKEERIRVRNALLYIADCMAAVNDMQETHNCNDCGIEKRCSYAPAPGQRVRWNCPLWQEREKENSEPVYPTWWQYLSERGILAAGRSNRWEPINDTVCGTVKLFQPIDAETAQKLGLQPKARQGNDST